MPVLPLLEEWLNAECTTCQALTPKDRAGLDRLVNYYGRGMQDVDSAWWAMLVAANLPTTREWRPSVCSTALRHVCATLAPGSGI